MSLAKTYPQTPNMKLADTFLPQPPSFSKKKNYDVHQVLGTGTFGKVMVCLMQWSSSATVSILAQRATWHVPLDQVATAEKGASADLKSTLTVPSKNQSRSSLSVSASPKTSRPSSPAPSGILKDVALKMIPKKKVKGNESSVWGEMEVLKGLDHPNIVRKPSVYLLIMRY